MLKSDVYHLLHMCHISIEIRMKFRTLENLRPTFCLTPSFLGSRKYRTFPKSANIYTYIHTHTHLSVQYRNQFPKDILSTNFHFTHISALKADTNTQSQSPCKAWPLPPPIMISQNITFTVFTTTASKVHYSK
jgi:hypothetical protein